LVGDALYGSTVAGPLELFSWKLNFIDPANNEKINLEATLNLFQK
jgi:hypothetical protein